MRRAFVFLTILALLVPASRAAASSPIVNETDVTKNGTDSFVDVNPCTGDRARITITFNDVFHITVFADETVHVTGTTTGTFLLDTIKASEPDFTGHFTSWFGFNGNTRNAAGEDTFTIIGEGTDGSTLMFHETETFVVNANGDVTVEFMKVRCG